MYAVWGTITVKPEHVKEFAENFRVHAQLSNEEPGCVRFDAFQDADDPTIFCIYEVFNDKEANVAHDETEHYKRWREMSRNWRQESRPPSRILNLIYPEPGSWR